MGGSKSNGSSGAGGGGATQAAPSFPSYVSSTFLQTDYSRTPVDLRDMIDVAMTPQDFSRITRTINRRVDTDRDFTPGAAQRLVEARKEFARRNTTPGRSPQDARDDQRLRTRDSDGRATSRRWG